MLNKIRAYHDGIVDYLTNGAKSGRDYHRDELDERVVLAGDLGVTGLIIDSIDSKSNRYQSFVLSFKEDYLDKETLRQITKDFEKFVFSAYQSDEYDFYAEAHLPKIQSYIDKSNGELVDRKPHIHLVVPKTNLLTGQFLDPLGYFNHSAKYIDAFKEYVNYKYNLASPKDNQRLSFTNSSDILSRYKGDLYKGSNKEFRELLLAEVIKRDIKTLNGFSVLLSDYGIVEIGKKGKPDQYFKVKRPSDSKFIRLDDNAFSADFLALPVEEKNKFLTSGKWSAPKPTLSECETLLQEWHELRAKEAKYINSGSKKKYIAYKALSKEEKISFLNDQAEAFYQKHQWHDIEGLDTAVQSLENTAPVARPISPKVPDAGTGRTSDSVLGQSGRDTNEMKLQAQAGQLAEINEIKRHLDAKRLLAHLSKSHGVRLESHLVHKGQDGSDRIQCGNRNLNVADFLTKERNLSWKEAESILREVYAAQLAQVPAQPFQSRNEQLSQAYRQWKDTEIRQRQKETISNLRDERDSTISEARKQFGLKRGQIEGNKGLSKDQQRLQIDLAKAQREHAIKEARDLCHASEAAEKNRWSLKGNRRYMLYLAEVVQKNPELAEAALIELRKQQPDLVDKERVGEFIEAEDQNVQNEIIFRNPSKAMTYEVDYRGHITYQFDGLAVMKDEGRRLKILQATNPDVIEEALMLAKAKFGNKLTLTGSDEFKRQSVQIAVEKGLGVNFTDPKLQELKHSLEHEKAERKRLITIGRQQVAASKEQKNLKEKNEAEAKALAKAKAQEKAKAEETAREEKAKAKTIQPPAPKPQPVSIEPQISVPGSKPAPTDMTHKGEVVALDEHFVYQQTKHGIVHHAKEQFKEVPSLGDDVAIRYGRGQIQSVKPIDKGHTLGM